MDEEEYYDDINDLPQPPSQQPSLLRVQQEGFQLQDNRITRSSNNTQYKFDLNPSNNSSLYKSGHAMSLCSRQSNNYNYGGHFQQESGNYNQISQELSSMSIQERFSVKNDGQQNNNTIQDQLSIDPDNIQKGQFQLDEKYYNQENINQQELLQEQYYKELEQDKQFLAFQMEQQRQVEQNMQIGEKQNQYEQQNNLTLLQEQIQQNQLKQQQNLQQQQIQQQKINQTDQISLLRQELSQQTQQNRENTQQQQIQNNNHKNIDLLQKQQEKLQQQQNKEYLNQQKLFEQLEQDNQQDEGYTKYRYNVSQQLNQKDLNKIQKLQTYNDDETKNKKQQNQAIKNVYGLDSLSQLNREQPKQKNQNNIQRKKENSGQELSYLQESQMVELESQNLTLTQQPSLISESVTQNSQFSDGKTVKSEKNIYCRCGGQSKSSKGEKDDNGPHCRTKKCKCYIYARKCTERCNCDPSRCKRKDLTDEQIQLEQQERQQKLQEEGIKCTCQSKNRDCSLVSCFCKQNNKKCTNLCKCDPFKCKINCDSRQECVNKILEKKEQEEKERQEQEEQLRIIKERQEQELKIRRQKLLEQQQQQK